jgi:hypothetical protein
MALANLFLATLLQTLKPADGKGTCDSSKGRRGRRKVAILSKSMFQWRQRRRHTTPSGTDGTAMAPRAAAVATNKKGRIFLIAHFLAAGAAGECLSLFCLIISVS